MWRAPVVAAAALLGFASSTQAEQGPYGICPRGHYCPRGSGTPLPCPPGKVSAALGLVREDQCRNCTAGFYCSNSSTVEPTVPCEPGFYCEIGTVRPTTLCTRGHYCPGGDAVPIPCEAGSYTNVTGQSVCAPCPAGYYCEEAQVTPGDCPQGYYCPPETKYATEFACPNGTFSNKTLISAVDECMACLAGMFCETEGLSSPTGPCEAGYFCAHGSATQTPGDNDDDYYTGETCADQSDAEVNGVCPVGHYCPEQSSAPVQCPPGKMSAARGLTNVSQCDDCAAGYVCPESATINATVLCDPGFWCVVIAMGCS